MLLLQYAANLPGLSLGLRKSMQIQTLPANPKWVQCICRYAESADALPVRSWAHHLRSAAFRDEFLEEVLVTLPSWLPP